MAVRILRWIGVVGTGVTLGALAAHVLELPNKLALDGSLWLAVQQQLYRGWGPFTAPFEIGAIAACWALALLLRRRREVLVPTLIAVVALSAALIVFFAVTRPVNVALAGWTAATLPPDWPDYRLRWEAGHAANFVLVLAAFAAQLRAWFAAVRHEAWRQRSMAGPTALVDEA